MEQEHFAGSTGQPLPVRNPSLSHQMELHVHPQLALHLPIGPLVSEHFLGRPIGTTGPVCCC